ncbi:hypothetical protein QDX23_08610 [Auritidibacter ignavus]|uniref:hypothetical protein n=1 Tax=Auritidibacter ignavus TaxID=678932 RepID=UPI000D73C6A1|nr:hypothetical protein [Auritidibacter ignavus]AXR74467.1 hypothetical protein DCC27_009380 [Auritidibacter sp. NML130574]PXA79499.1 hypothetical protein DCC26_05390 [Auritidibacter sp. NML120779]WGH85591.1 hypothetical protein QDX24_08380 [Auritidibacter ignavus]WGH87879.1 hypothetical protein QDX22_08380 [Auritidibacter ignavus]WGH90180.1 hypothetical protein QDX23_08610 [Auritidibacter ignavus]
MTHCGPVEDNIYLISYADCSKVFAEPANSRGYEGDDVTTVALDPTATVMARIDAETENYMLLQVHYLRCVATRKPERDNAIGHPHATYVVRIITPIARQVRYDLANE